MDALHSSSPPLFMDDVDSLDKRQELPNLKITPDEGWWWKRKPIDFVERKNYTTKLDAFVDIKKQQNQLLKELEEKEDELRQSSENNLYNGLAIHLPIDKVSDLRQNNINLLKPPKSIPKNMVWRSPGGCGDPLVSSDGKILTRRSKLVRSIPGSCIAENLPSLLSQSELDLVESRRVLPGATDVSLQRLCRTLEKNVQKSSHNPLSEEYRLIASKKYLQREFEDEIEKKKLLRKKRDQKFKENMSEATPSILEKGKVGRRDRHLLTGVIIPEKRHFSDITFHLQNTRDIENPQAYISDLREMVEERSRKKREERNKTIEKDQKHIATFKTYFGNGVPCSSNVFRRKFSDCSLRVYKGKMGTAIKQADFMYNMANNSKLAASFLEDKRLESEFKLIQPLSEKI